MYTLYKFHFLNGISEINQLFDDILIIWPAPVYIFYLIKSFPLSHIKPFSDACLCYATQTQAPPTIVDWHWCFTLDPPWASC